MDEAWQPTKDIHYTTTTTGSLQSYNHSSMLLAEYQLSVEEIEGLLDDADSEGEGFISYAEFCSIKNLI